MNIFFASLMSVVIAIFPSAPTDNMIKEKTNSISYSKHEVKQKKNQRMLRVPVFSCKNSLANSLYEAGFRGNSLRMAWAIVMRESKGQNLDHSSRWFTGAYGIWQIQESAHRNKPWYSRSAMLTPTLQSRIVYQHLSQNGTNWSHWGLTPDGRLDARYYSRWSSWQHENWIMKPFRKYYSEFPC